MTKERRKQIEEIREKLDELHDSLYDIWEWEQETVENTPDRDKWKDSYEGAVKASSELDEALFNIRRALDNINNAI